MKTLRMREVVDLVGGRCIGDPEHEVTGLAPVDESEAGHLAFLAARRYVQYVDGCRAGAFLVAAELAPELPAGTNAAVVDDAYGALRTLLVHLHPVVDDAAAVHPTAVLASGVRLGPGVSIGPYAVLETGVEVGAGTRIGAHCVLGSGTTLGAGCRLHAHVVTYHDTSVGNGVEIHAGARLGTDGFGYTFVNGAHAKIPQVGRCVIEDDVEIGANSTVDRGSLGDTRLGRGVKLDNLVHVAHNVRIGAHSLLAALVGIAGSTRIGKGVWLGGQSGVINQIDVGDGARIAIQSGVTRDVPAGETVSGYPARPHREALRRDAEVGRVSRLRNRVTELEAEVARLRARLDGETGSDAG